MDVVFKKRFITDDWHWDYQFHASNFDYELMYEWCLDNLGANLDWTIIMQGVLIRNEDDAVLFALRWC